MHGRLAEMTETYHTYPDLVSSPISPPAIKVVVGELTNSSFTWDLKLILLELQTGTIVYEIISIDAKKFNTLLQVAQFFN